MSAPMTAPGPGLDGQHAIVTGGARGVGREIAVQLAAWGAAVTVFDVLDTDTTVKLVNDAGGQASGVCVDVSDREAVHQAVRSAVAGRPLDMLVTSAAIYGTATTIDDVTDAEFSSVMSVNVGGVIWAAQAALPSLRQTAGRIVCIGSLGGRVGGVLAGPHYTASKAGVHTVVRALAKSEAPHGVRVNGVAPGAIDTDMIAGKGYRDDYCPLGRLAAPAEIAAVAVFLCGPQASYMTGAVVDVNGGYHFS